MKDFKILFIHGYNATSQTDFYPPLTLELDKINIDYALPILPGGRYPQSKVWLQILHETIARNKKPLIIIGHSLGTRAALLFIEKYQLEVDALFLIGAFANRIENGMRRNGEAYPDFFMHTVDTESIKKLVKRTYVLHSEDDSSILFEQGQAIAHEMNGELIVSEKRGHFDSPSVAPYILSVLKDKLGF